MRRKLKKYIIIYYMCVICGYEIAGTWVRNGMVLGTKWYEFWVRNGMPGVGISPAPALHPYCSICAALFGLNGILWSNIVTM